MRTNRKKDRNQATDRRSFIAKTVVAGTGMALSSWPANGNAQTSSQQDGKDAALGRRRLGKLEVSAVGIGVQNMHRRYETTVPYRPEMIAILRAAYDRGITFFDTAEANGPWENERILGEAIQPFRNKVRITSKFGWNIDQHWPATSGPQQQT